MRKRPLEILAAGYLLGAVCAAAGFARLGIPIAMILLITYIRFFRREHPCAEALFFLCVFVAGSLRTGIWEYGYRADEPPAIGKKEMTAVEGRIEEIVDRSEGIRMTIGDANVCKVGENGDLIHEGGRWYVYLTGDVAVTCTQVERAVSYEDLLPGQRILVTGTISLPEPPGNEGEFDYRTFCLAHEIRGSVFPTLVRITDVRSAPIGSFFLRLRRTAMRALSCAPGEDYGLLAAVLVGNRSFVSDREYDDFTEAGAGHILSISGIHLSILCYGFFRLLRSLRMPIPMRALLPVGLVWFYALFAGLPVSALRASIMFTVLMGGELLGRRYDIRSSMAAALLILLIFRPGYLLLTGMQYSFAALLGICFMVPLVQECLGERFHPSARKALAGYLGVFLSTLPLQCLYNFEFSPYSILFNGVLIPCMGLLLGTGFMGIAAGALSAGSPGLLSSVAGALFRIPHLILVLYRLVSGLPSVLPVGMILTGKPSACGVCFYAAAGGLILVLSLLRKKSRYLFLLTLLPLFLFHPNGASTQIDVLDVGQGSCAVISMQDGRVVMIDCGSTDRKKLAEDSLIPWMKANRITQIDLAVVSHMDTDHMDGFRQLAKAEVPIRRIVLTDRKEESEEAAEFEALMKKLGSRIRYAGAGDVLASVRRGEDEIAALTVLAPEHGAVRSEENEYSLVLGYREGSFFMLFPGDLGLDGEERMVELLTEHAGTAPSSETGENPMIRTGGILLAGHHGSMYSTGEAFLAFLRPHLTIFSAGKGNSYGHPHSETFERVSRAGSAAACTIDAGQVTITVKKDKFTVKFFKAGLRKEER